MAGYHKVQQGECLSSLANQYAFSDYGLIYDHSKNALLKKKRPNPNMLLPDDCLFIPEKQEKQQARATSQTHHFKVRSSTVMLRMALLDEEEQPYANKRYILNINNTAVYRDITDAQGKIEKRIPADAIEATLTLYLEENEAPPAELQEAEENPAGAAEVENADEKNTEADADQEDESDTLHVRLAIGFLGPVEEIAGVQARLNNLGYFCGSIDGLMGPKTERALKRFQRKIGMEPTGKVDAQIRDQLRKQHDVA